MLYQYAGLIGLKATGDCDHYANIQIPNEMLPVLKKSEKLSYAEDTRDLEKDLRREDDKTEKAELILNFWSIKKPGTIRKNDYLSFNPDCRGH